jgi:hypothetical protein
LSEVVVLALQKRWRRLPPTKQSLSQMEGDCFYRRLVPAPVTFPDSRQPDRHSIPIALGPAQFNEFYRPCPPQVFPTLRIFSGGGADRMLLINGIFAMLHADKEFEYVDPTRSNRVRACWMTHSSHWAFR